MSYSIRRHLDESFDVERGLDRPEQSGVAEWSEPTFDGALFEYAWAEGLVPMRRDKDDRNGLPAPLLLALQVHAGLAGHGDIEDQAAIRAPTRRRPPREASVRPSQVPLGLLRVRAPAGPG